VAALQITDTCQRRRSPAFYAATARQIARDFADLDPGPGIDASPALPRSPLLPLRVDAIDWEMAPAETIPAEGGILRASTIAYRELAQAGCSALHVLHHQHDRLVLQHHQLHDEARALRDDVKALRASLLVTHSEPTPTPTRQTRLPLSGLPSLSGVRRVQGVRGL